MAISLKVLAPNKNVYQGEAEEVILPSTTGQLGVLPGHISLVTAIDIGVLRLRMKSQWKSIALMGGFAEIESDEVIVLVNNAEIGSEINVQNAERDLKGRGQDSSCKELIFKQFRKKPLQETLT